jgi:UrcA family protein
MNIWTSRRQPRLGAALLAASILPLAMSAALAESPTIEVVVNRAGTNEGPAAVTHQQTVSYSDLALDTTHGFETLNRRIATAVNNVCMRSDPRELGSMRDVRVCRQQALARANTDIQQLDGAEAFGLK